MYVEKDITMITGQRLLSLLGVCVLLLAFAIPYLFPQWEVYTAQFLRTHRLFIGALLLIMIFLLLWKYPQWQVAAVRDRKDRIDLESKSRQTLAQIVGGAVLLVGLYFTAQTLRTTQEGQITDRFTKAIDHLGKDKLAVRLGAIYALERIARDSEYDHWAVMEILTAFVREQPYRSWFSTQN
jgi:type VI protein secretion system component VasK